MSPLTRRIAYWMLERTIRRTFRQLVWIGKWAPPPASRPTILYSNHHAFYDGQLLALLCERVLGRPPIVWVEDLDRFPFLAPLGAMRFPKLDPAARMTTIRRTVRLMQRNPRTIMIYFPEGKLHPVEDGIAQFPSERFERLGRVFDDVMWWPVAVRLRGWEHAWPTATFLGAPSHARPTGRERAVLQQLTTELAHVRVEDGRLLLDGRPSPHERWNMTWMRRLFLRGSR